MTWEKSSTITVNVQYAPIVSPHHRQTRGETEGGSAKVYNYGTDIYYITVPLRVVSTSKLVEIRDFIKDELIGSKETFTMTPDSIHDLGAGAGVAITARLWEDDWEEKMIASEKYPVKLRFRKEN